MCQFTAAVHNPHSTGNEAVHKTAANRSPNVLSRMLDACSFTERSAGHASQVEVSADKRGALATAGHALQVEVSPGKRGALAEALADAEENSTLVLSPGLYVEEQQLKVPAGVSIVCRTPFNQAQLLKRAQGAEWKEARISVSCAKLGNAPFVSIRERGGMLQNIVLEVTEDEDREYRQFPCLDISGGDIQILQCGVVCKNRSGIRVKGTATPKIERCVLTCSKEGIIIQGRASPTVDKNIIAVNEVAIRAGQNSAGRCTGNTLQAERDACIVGEGMSRTVFIENKLSIDTSSKFGCAVVVRNSCSVTLERNHIAGSHYNGMQIGDCAKPCVKENEIIGSRASGIVVHEFATGIFVRNRVERSKLAGIGIRDSAEPYFKGNVVCDGAASGVVVMGEAECIFEENKIRNNQGSGVRITAKSSNVLFDGNEVSGNKACGFWLDGECASTLQNNRVMRSERAGIYVTQKAAPKVSHNVVSEGETAGVLLDDEAGGDFNSNVISKNAACNVMLGGRSTGVFESNLVTGSPSGGVLCFAESACVLRKNRVEDNATANIAVLDSANPTATGNIIKNGRGRGLVAGGSSRGLFTQNEIVGNDTEGVYVGGHAKPTLERNSVSQNGASGMVIEDWAEAQFTDNVFRDNESAAVVVQGHSKPTLERTTIKHNGNGGIWLMERAGGTIRDTTMDNEHFEGSWRRGMRVRTKVVQAEDSARTQGGFSQDAETRLPSIGRRIGHSTSKRGIALIFNPGSDGCHAIAACSLGDTPRASTASSPCTVLLPEIQVPSQRAKAQQASM